MTIPSGPGTRAALRPALVVGTSEDACTSSPSASRPWFRTPRSSPIPAPAGVPGHLVATATAPGGVPVVVWRWFDAVVVEEVAGQVRLLEPARGEVIAQARDPRRSYRPGSRAYLSAGLEGADWWLEPRSLSQRTPRSSSMRSGAS